MGFFFFPRQNTGAGCDLLLQEIFLTPGSEWASLGSSAWVRTVPPGKPCNNRRPLFAACLSAAVRVPLPCAGMMRHAGGSPQLADAPRLPACWMPPAPRITSFRVLGGGSRPDTHSGTTHQPLAALCRRSSSLLLYHVEEKVTISVCPEVCVGGGGGGELSWTLGGSLRGAAQHPEELMARG